MAVILYLLGCLAFHRHTILLIISPLLVCLPIAGPEESRLKLSIELILNSATDEERRVLALILDSWSSTPDALTKKLQNQSLNIFQWAIGSTRSYEEILVKVASKHGISRRLFETDEDLERRLIRSVARKSLSIMTPNQRETFEQQMNFAPHVAGVGGIVLAKASGFGIYQMSSTVVGALTAAAGLKLPFLAYMAMSKAIWMAIGPLGWLGIGAATLHTLTKPNYARLVAAIACIGGIRQRLDPRVEWQSYSITEIIRKGLKLTVLLSLLLGVIWGVRAC